MANSNTWRSAYSNRTDLTQYGDNALGLFSLALHFSIDDLETIAADCITDGFDDKKTDIVFINKDDAVAVIAQCYLSTKDRASAPANKASDLNTAVGWLIQRPIEELPNRVKSAAKELRDNIEDGTIKKICLWYIHNLPESDNVLKELQTVESTAQAALKLSYPKISVNVQALEVGENKLEEWYQDTQSPILVSDKIKIPIENGFEVNGPEWKSYVTYVPARLLSRLHKKYKTRLFSANVRDYLGSRDIDANINHGIKRTIEETPENFLVYNNGVTALVNGFKEISIGSSRSLEIDGISIVNGAQTTGALGTFSRFPSLDASVSVRFITTSNTDIVRNIVRYNNSQNKVTASDFRSTDRIQKRLRAEIEQIPDSEYEGGRRGGHADAIKRRPKLLPSYTVGQALAALHGEPIVAYNEKSNIWISDKIYSRLFNDDTTGHHLVFAFSLLKAIESKKQNLVDKFNRSESSLTASEQLQLEYFRQRGSIYLLVGAVSNCLETLLKRRIPNLFRLSFGNTVSPKSAQQEWAKIIDTLISFSPHLMPGLDGGLKSMEQVKKAISTYQSLVEATSEANRNVYNLFASKVISSTR